MERKDTGERALSGIIGCKACVGNDIGVTVPGEKATANYVPAAAVIRRWRALSGIIGRKEGAGGTKGLW